jgi:SAM-dependent methyltransferase
MKGARVVCSDMDGPSIQARQVHQIAGVSDRIQYQAIDATRIPYADQFDVVTCKSVLGAIGIRRGPHAQAKAVSEIRRALCPGGELFFAENLAGSPFHHRVPRPGHNWGDGSGFVTVQAMLDFVAPFAQVCYGIMSLGGEPEPAGQPAGGINRIGRLMRDRSPERSRFIIVGVARK